MIQLPSTPQGQVKMNPTKMLIFSYPKVGKTTIVSQLPNHLIIATEDGTGFNEGEVVIDIRKEAIENNTTLAGAMKMIIEALKAAYQQGKQYDYLIIDTATAMEEIANEIGCILYKKTDMGKGWNGNDITTLPRGAGYGYLREAYMTLYNQLSPFAKKCLILLAHPKRSSISKGGEELAAIDIQLTGALKTLVCADMDVIGYLYPKENQRILSFKTSETDLATGSRLRRLSGQEVVISEDDGEKIITHWDKIFV